MSMINNIIPVSIALLETTLFVSQQACRKGGGGFSPSVFGRSVSPISTRGGHIIPTQYYKPPRIFRPCDGPGRNRALEMHTQIYLSIIEFPISYKKVV
jgi:hypothetical protein